MTGRERGRPSADPTERREQVVTTKLNKREGEAWGELLEAMASAGPRPREADAVRWLMKAECQRRGIVWPLDGAPASSGPEPEASRGPAKRRGKI